MAQAGRLSNLAVAWLAAARDSDSVINMTAYLSFDCLCSKVWLSSHMQTPASALSA